MLHKSIDSEFFFCISRLARAVLAPISRSRRARTTLPRYHVTALPRYCFATLLRRYVTALLRYHVATLLRFYVTSLLRYCVTTLPRCYVTALLRYRVAALPRSYVTASLRYCAAKLPRCYVTHLFVLFFRQYITLCSRALAPAGRPCLPWRDKRSSLSIESSPGSVPEGRLL